MKNFLLISILFYPFFGSAQNSYIVTLKGDTLYGDVTLRNYNNQPDKIMFKNGKDKTLFSSLEIRKVSVKGKIFHTIKYGRRYELMQLVKPGFLSTYYRKGAGQWEYAELCLVKKDGTSIVVPNIGFKKIVGEFLSECEILQGKIDTKEYNKKDITTIVDEYNQCLDNNKPVVARKEPINEDISPLQAEQVQLLSSLKDKVGVTGIESKSEILELISDLETKVRENKKAPSYLTGALKEYLSGNEELVKMADRLLQSLQSNGQ